MSGRTLMSILVHFNMHLPVFLIALNENYQVYFNTKMINTNKNISIISLSKSNLNLTRNDLLLSIAGKINHFRLKIIIAQSLREFKSIPAHEFLFIFTQCFFT